MASEKVTFEPHANSTVSTVLPDGKTLRLGEGDTYETSDPTEVRALDMTNGVKRAEKKASR